MKKLALSALIIVLFLSLANSVQADSERLESGFNTKTNQTLTWCGIDFSIPSYFNVFGVIEDNAWVHYYPEEEEYYASLMFQSFELAESQEYFLSALPDIIKATFYSGDDTLDEIHTSEKAIVAGLPGWTVKYTTQKDENGIFSDDVYTISFNPETEKVSIITCIVDNTDKSNFDYFGDYYKMMGAAKLSSQPTGIKPDISISSESKYDFAYARKFSEYSIYMLFDIEDKIVREFVTNDTGVMVGTIKGSLSKGISIHYNYDGGWDETFKLKNKNQSTAILIDNDGFELDYVQVPVEEAENILNSGGYKDIEFY